MKIISKYVPIIVNPNKVTLRDVIVLKDDIEISVANIGAAFFFEHRLYDSESILEKFPELAYHLDVLEECKKARAARRWNLPGRWSDK
jgi:hypothetical protein